MPGCGRTNRDRRGRVNRFGMKLLALQKLSRCARRSSRGCRLRMTGVRWRPSPRRRWRPCAASAPTARVRRWRFANPTDLAELIPATATHVGRMLLEENTASVNHLYNEHHAPNLTYTYRPPPAHELVDPRTAQRAALLPAPGVRAPSLGQHRSPHVDRTPFVSRNASFPTTIHRRQAVMTRDSVVLDDRDDMAREKMPPLVPTVLGRDVHLGLRQDSPPR